MKLKPNSVVPRIFTVDFLAFLSTTYTFLWIQPKTLYSISNVFRYYANATRYIIHPGRPTMPSDCHVLSTKNDFQSGTPSLSPL